MGLNKNIIIKIIFLLLMFIQLKAQTVKKDYVKIGGMVRYNMFLIDYESDFNNNDLQFTWDAWRLNVEAMQSGIQMSFEYRFYPTFGTHFLKKGWFGYKFENNFEIRLGVTQVPFGNLPFGSFSYWFSTAYYAGIEDDYDMGIKLLYNTANWEFALAFFLQPEPSGYAKDDVSYGIGGSARYSYDVIPVANQSNQEKNQINIRVARKIKSGENLYGDFGLSFMYGGIYNSKLNNMKDRYAFALHTNLSYHKLNIKTQYNYHKYNAVDDKRNSLDLVQMGAYGSGVYPVAAKASMYTIGVSYNVNVKWGPITKLTFYNDYTYTDKSENDFEDTIQNTLGLMVSAGSIFIYIDQVLGKNHPWLTDNYGTGLGKGVKDARWNSRFNINIGYYF